MAHRTMQARRRAAMRAQQHPPRPSWRAYAATILEIGIVGTLGGLATYLLATRYNPAAGAIALALALVSALITLASKRHEWDRHWFALRGAVWGLVGASALVYVLTVGGVLTWPGVPSLPAQERPAVPASAPPVPTTERVGREPAQTRPDGSGATEAAPPVVDTPKIGREAPTAAPPPVMDTPKEGKVLPPKQELAPAVEAPKEGKAIETVYVMQAEPEKMGKEQPGEEKVGKEARP